MCGVLSASSTMRSAGRCGHSSWRRHARPPRMGCASRGLTRRSWHLILPHSPRRLRWPLRSRKALRVPREDGGDFYPVVLRLRDRRVLVVGGGKVGARKAAGLVEAGAHVVVVSPRFEPAFARLVDAAALTLIERRYTAEDLAGMALVVAATDDRAVNAPVSADARRAGALVSVGANPRESDFIRPAAARRGDLLLPLS